jgi:hypothetical protein
MITGIRNRDLYLAGDKVSICYSHIPEFPSADMRNEFALLCPR